MSRLPPGRTAPPRFRHDYLSTLPTLENLQEFLRRQFAMNYYGGVEEKDFGHRLFDPACNDVRTLPSGLLGQKEEPLPPDLVPKTRKDLENLFRAYVNCNGDEPLIELTVAAWRRPVENRQPTIGSHARDMWDLAQASPDHFENLICSQHGSSVKKALDGELPNRFPWERFAVLTARTAHLWCARDAQMVMGMVYRAEHKPFGEWGPNERLGAPAGEFFVCDGGAPVPHSAIKAGRSDRDLAEQIFINRHLGAEELEARFFQLTEDRPHFRTLYSTLQSGMTPDTERKLRPTILGLLEAVSTLAGHGGGDEFWKEISQPRTSADLNGKTFSHLWFSGLSAVTACAVPILRLVQFESEIESMLKKCYLEHREGHPFSGIEFAAFPRKKSAGAKRPNRKLPPGSLDRARKLLDANRRVLLQDKNWRSQTYLTDDARGEAYSDDVVPSQWDVGGHSCRRAAKFLERMGQRSIEDHQGDRFSERRTFYLLDVLPDIRFARRSWREQL